MNYYKTEIAKLDWFDLLKYIPDYERESEIFEHFFVLLGQAQAAVVRGDQTEGCALAWLAILERVKHQFFGRSKYTRQQKLHENQESFFDGIGNGPRDISELITFDTWLIRIVDSTHHYPYTWSAAMDLMDVFMVEESENVEFEDLIARVKELGAERRASLN